MGAGAVAAAGLITLLKTMPTIVARCARALKIWLKAQRAPLANAALTAT